MIDIDIFGILLIGFLLGAATTLMGNEIKDIQGKEVKLVYFLLMIVFLAVLFYFETKIVW